MPDFPTWVNDALAGGQIEASDLDGWYGIGGIAVCKDFMDAGGEKVTLRADDWPSDPEGLDKLALDWCLYVTERDGCVLFQTGSGVQAVRAANNLIAALEGNQPGEVKADQPQLCDVMLKAMRQAKCQPSPEVERLQKRVGELEEAAKDYVAWLVERRDVPGSLRYLAFNSIGEPCWVDCADDACHFARKPDAMQWAEAETMELHVCDHQWSGGTPRDPVIQQYEWRKDDAN